MTRWTCILPPHHSGPCVSSSSLGWFNIFRCLAVFIGGAAAALVLGGILAFGINEIPW